MELVRQLAVCPHPGLLLEKPGLLHEPSRPRAAPGKDAASGVSVLFLLSRFRNVSDM